MSVARAAPKASPAARTAAVAAGSWRLRRSVSSGAVTPRRARRATPGAVRDVAEFGGGDAVAGDLDGGGDGRAGADDGERRAGCGAGGVGGESGLAVVQDGRSGGLPTVEQRQDVTGPHDAIVADETWYGDAEGDLGRSEFGANGREVGLEVGRGKGGTGGELPGAFARGSFGEDEQLRAAEVNAEGNGGHIFHCQGGGR
jgi:hypothetical protein